LDLGCLESYVADETAQKIIAKLEIDASAIPNFALNQGLLRYKSRFWIGADAALQKWLVDACHSSALGELRRCLLARE
jgi:hypothetical protein